MSHLVLRPIPSTTVLTGFLSTLVGTPMISVVDVYSRIPFTAASWALLNNLMVPPQLKWNLLVVHSQNWYQVSHQESPDELPLNFQSTLCYLQDHRYSNQNQLYVGWEIPTFLVFFSWFLNAHWLKMHYYVWSLNICDSSCFIKFTAIEIIVFDVALNIYL